MPPMLYSDKPEKKIVQRLRVFLLFITIWPLFGIVYENNITYYYYKKDIYGNWN